MICIDTVIKYCKDDLSLIENYEEALNSPETWHCHHRLETDLNVSKQYLIDHDLYLNRPASELIFLTPSEHSKLHSAGKNFMDNMTSEAIEQWRKNLSESHLGENNGMYGKNCKDFMTSEAIEQWRKNLSESHLGKDPWNKGLKGVQKAHNKGKKLHIREDGTHYYA